MSEIVAKRYAEGFLSYAKETIGLERAIADLKNIKIIFRANPEFEKLLETLEVTYTEKCAIIDRVFEKGFAEETKHFLKLLVEKGRIGNIIDIADYVRTTYGHGEKVDGMLSSVFPLELESLEAIKQKVETKLRKELNLYLNLDPDLIGGVCVAVGSFVFDGSVRRRLGELKEKLMTIRVG